MFGKLNGMVVAFAALGMTSVIASPQFNARPKALTSFGSFPDETVADEDLSRDESEATPELVWEVPAHTRTEKEIVAELSRGNSTKDTASLLRELQMAVAKSNSIADSLTDDDEE
ncbi:hypothetical protein DSO57_1030646 [Entomophthora muscae]|uniref:Uncharacterized protein n=1 Tax=Entomophthora muscae TaxID=34485 RepID=A0ACC2T0U7_9FUNG|nr:hypothetical protein DSO57_1030646 [Entomophthora muscae]